MPGDPERRHSVANVCVCVCLTPLTFIPRFVPPLQKADDTKSMAEPKKKKNRRGRWLQRLVAKGGCALRNRQAERRETNSETEERAKGWRKRGGGSRKMERDERRAKRRKDERTKGRKKERGEANDEREERG